MKLKELLHGLDVLELHADEDLDITGVQYDSRQVTSGDLFVAISGFQTDGHRYIPKAMENGAVCVVCEKKPETDIAYALVPDARAALAALGANWFGHPSDSMCMIGITGTNGKTTSTYLLKHVLEKTLGAKVGLIGTIQNMIGDEILHTERTTPESFELQKLFAEMKAAGCTHVIMEVSSHALVLHRADQNSFRVGVFNGDEPLLWNVRADGGHKKYYFGIENHTCDVLATDIQELEDGMRFVVSGFGHRFELFVPVLGRHTVYNALAAVTAALLLKIPPETIQAQISGFQNTGMRQKIYERDGFTIIEDCYNAGPESTEAALDILAGFRARAKGRCIAVLGDMLELGNRSAAEHYRIGRIAAAKVDMLYTYGTNSERMVSGAITGGMKQKFVEHFDTHEDLAHMLKMRARPGDVILFKGSRGMRMEKALSLFLKEEES